MGVDTAVSVYIIMSSYIHQGGYVFAFVGLSVGEQITKNCWSYFYGILRNDWI